METTVTKPIEDIINTVSGIDELRSTTQEGISVVTVQFLLSKNGDVGAQEVRDKVSSILATLPEGTETPIVNKFDTDAMPVLTLAVSGRRDLREVTELARKRIKERLETVAGVGADQPGRRPDPVDQRHRRCRQARRLRPLDRRRPDRAWSGRTWRSPAAGSTRGPASWSSGPSAGSTRPQQFDDLIITNSGGYPIRIKDVGKAEDSYEEPRTNGPARRRERRQPGRPEAVGDQHRQGRRRPARPGSRRSRPPSRPTSRSSSPRTSRGSSGSRSRR